MSKHGLHTQNFMRSSENGSVMGAYLWCDCGWPGNWVGDVPGTAVDGGGRFVKTVMAGKGMPLTMEVSHAFAVHIKEWGAANPCTCTRQQYITTTHDRYYRIQNDDCPQHGGEQSQPSQLEESVTLRQMKTMPCICNWRSNGFPEAHPECPLHGDPAVLKQLPSHD